MKVPLGDKIKNDYIILGFDPNSIPDDINLTRFHFSQAFGQLFDLGVSALIVPDIDYYGAGLNLSLNVFNFEMLYTTMSLKYAQSKTDRVFSSSSLGFGISQSVNLNWIDLFAGVNYIKGSTTFTPTGAANELPINDVNASGVETYIGGVLVLTGNLRGTFQINNTNAEQTFGMKISFKISSFMPLVPLWMTTEDHF